MFLVVLSLARSREMSFVGLSRFQHGKLGCSVRRISLDMRSQYLGLLW